MLLGEQKMSDLKGVKVKWYGHATVLVTTAHGTSILIDPWFDGNPAYSKSSGVPKKVDLILCTHGHSDHVADAVRMAREYEATVVAMVELATWLGRHGAEKTVGMNLGGSYVFKDVTVSMVEAKHSTGMDDKDVGRLLYGGVASGFVVESKDGDTVYHAGDTTVFGDMKLIGELYRPKLAMLPIGDYYTMGPRLAAHAARLLGAEQVLPIHYGTFPQLRGTPEELVRELGDSSIKVRAIKPGETV
jgi:L-ascorbate metabolism protein UlaG (beta-lactamase superfamily)